MTNEQRDEINSRCPLCAQGMPAVPHLGIAEWIHSLNNRGQYMVTACQASDLWVKYQETMKNG